MKIESMNSFQNQCIKSGLQIDKAGLSTKIQSQIDETNVLYVKTGMSLASSQLASSTSRALFWMKWSWLGIWGKGVKPDTEYNVAKQLSSETVKT